MKVFKSYWQPTPVIWRKLGDSLLAAGTMAQTYTLVSGNDKYMQWVVICCIVGKFITNFVGEITLNEKASEKP